MHKIELGLHGALSFKKSKTTFECKKLEKNI
jgi:hypothetical protein